MEYEWIIGRYEGKQADWAESQAAVGVGYFIQRVEGKGKGREVYAAFKRAVDSPVSNRLETATPAQAEKLEAMSHKRNGVWSEEPFYTSAKKTLDGLTKDEVYESARKKVAEIRKRFGWSKP